MLVIRACWSVEGVRWVPFRSTSTWSKVPVPAECASLFKPFTSLALEVVQCCFALESSFLDRNKMLISGVGGGNELVQMCRQL